MFRMSTFAGIVVASTLATSAIFVGATGSVANSPTKEIAMAQVASPAATTVSATTTASVSIAPTAAVVDDTCARKVKVVYAGYGEGGLGCAKR